MPTKNQTFCTLLIFFIHPLLADKCLITDGSAPNIAPCQCESEVCDAATGLICYSTFGGGACRQNTPGPFGYPLPINTGFCATVSGRKNIGDKKTCEAAALALGLNDQTAFERSDNDRPPGCYIIATGSRNLYLNNFANSDAECSDEMNCLCVAVDDCVNTGGTVSNMEPCLCVGKVCDDQSGFYCTNTSSCSTIPSCPVRDGSTSNDQNCTCGSADCTEETGLICDPEKSSCKSEVSCMANARKSAPMCKKFNSNCLCTQCQKGNRSPDCSKECPTAGVAIFLDMFWLFVALWLFVAFVYYTHRRTNNDDSEDDLDAEDEVKRQEVKEQRKQDGLDASEPAEAQLVVPHRRGRLRLRSLRTILISRMQITAAILMTVVWSQETPPFLSEFGIFLSNIFTLNIGHMLISPDCVDSLQYHAPSNTTRFIPTGPMGKWYIEIFFPFLLLTFFAIWHQCLRKDSVAKWSTKRSRMAVGTAGIQVLFLWLFESLTTTSLKILDCTEGTTGKLVMYPSLPCSFGNDPFAAALGIIVLVMYVILPWTWFFRDQWCKRGDGGTWFTWALQDYTTSFRAWELWHVLCKCMIVLGASVMYPEFRFYTHGAVSVMSFIAHIMFRPYKDKESNNALILFTFSDVLGANSAWAPQSPTQGNRSFAGVQIAFLISLLFTLLYISYNVVNAFRERLFDPSFQEYTKMEKRLLLPVIGCMNLFIKLFPRILVVTEDFDNDDTASISSSDPHYMSRTNSNDRLMQLVEVEEGDGEGEGEGEGEEETEERGGGNKEKGVVDEVEDLDNWLEGKQIEVRERERELECGSDVDGGGSNNETEQQRKSDLASIEAELNETRMAAAKADVEGNAEAEERLRANIKILKNERSRMIEDGSNQSIDGEIKDVDDLDNWLNSW